MFTLPQNKEIKGIKQTLTYLIFNSSCLHTPFDAGMPRDLRQKKEIIIITETDQDLCYKSQVLLTNYFLMTLYAANNK